MLHLEYRYDCDDIPWDEVETLFKAANLGGRAGAKIRRSFEKSSLVCFAFAGGRLIALCRALTDWEYHAVLYDVAVHPAWQRQGIGSAMLHAVLARLPVWRVMLVSDDEDAQRFYHRLGFEAYENIMARFDWGRLYDAPAGDPLLSLE